MFMTSLTISSSFLLSTAFTMANAAPSDGPMTKNEKKAAAQVAKDAKNIHKPGK
jgi:hypothetical protein